jgi:hypothetical protein
MTIRTRFRHAGARVFARVAYHREPEAAGQPSLKPLWAVLALLAVGGMIAVLAPDRGQDRAQLDGARSQHEMRSATERPALTRCEYAPGPVPDFGIPDNVEIADIPSYAERGCPEPGRRGQ